MALIALEDAKDFLRIDPTDTAGDAKLQEFVDAASYVANFYVGDLEAATYTETHDGGGKYIFTRHTPVVSVASLTEYIGTITYTLTNQPLGQSVDNWGYTIDDAQAGRILRRSASGLAWRFVPGSGNVTITYSTGVAVIPPNVMVGVKAIIKHLWETQRGANARPLGGMSDGESSVPGLSYAVPNRAIEMFEATPRMPVIG